VNARERRHLRRLGKLSPKESDLRCSFCNKGKREVGQLVAGSSGYICGECVVLCVEILDQPQIAEQLRRELNIPGSG